MAMSSSSRSNLASETISYVPPSWCQEGLCAPPAHGKLALANLPTPLYRLDISNRIFEKVRSLGASLYIKRDDCTGGAELGGNKIRKLDFLLADAVSNDCDSVVTIGGEQSNHCRATAAAARQVGLEPHLILRTSKAKGNDGDGDIGLTGNVCNTPVCHTQSRKLRPLISSFAFSAATRFFLIEPSVAIYTRALRANTVVLDRSN